MTRYSFKVRFVLLTIGCNYSAHTAAWAAPGSRLWMISKITEWPLDLCSYCIFFVVSAVDEAPSASGAFGAFRPFAAEEGASASVVGCLVLLAFTTKAEEHGRDQKRGHRSPLETESILAEVGVKTSAAEFVTSKNVGRSVTSQYTGNESSERAHNSRHKRSSQRLEEQGDAGEKTAEIAAKTRAESQHASEQGAHGEE